MSAPLSVPSAHSGRPGCSARVVRFTSADYNLTHRYRRALKHPSNLPETDALFGHPPALLSLLLTQRRESPHSFPTNFGPRQPALDALPSGVHLISVLGQHGATEEFGRCAILPGVDVLLQGHDGDVLLGQIRWMRTPSSKVLPARPWDGEFQPVGQYSGVPGADGRATGSDGTTTDSGMVSGNSMRKARRNRQKGGRGVPPGPST